MSSSPRAQTTELLLRWHDGDPLALSELFPLVYHELHDMAQAFMRGERRGQTLQTTALIHEAFLRLVADEQQTVENRRQFFFLAARAMRQTLVERARARLALKRGGGRIRVELEEDLFKQENPSDAILFLETALSRMERFDLNKAKIAELKLFGGFTAVEIAELLQVTDRTVERHWRLAQAWLRKELQG